MGVWSQGGALQDILARLNSTPKPPLAASGIMNPPAVQREYSPMNIAEKKAQQFGASDALHSVIGQMGQFDVAPDPQYDWATKAEHMASQMSRYAEKAALQRAKNAQIAVANSNINLGLGGVHSTINIAPHGGGHSASIGGGPVAANKFQAFLRAIAGQESGGNYGAVNSSSGAMGKYQIMPSNIAGPGGWDQEALGHNITTQRFLHSPRLQERIAQYKLHNYFANFGPRGAASAWYSGDPNKYKNNSPQGGYPSIAAYVQAIIRRMQGYM